jgi:hypothetical protein
VLDARYRRISLALKAYALSMVVAMLAALGALVVALLPVGPALLSFVVLTAEGIGALSFVVSALAVIVYATIPSESGARGWGVVAALGAVLQLATGAGGVALLLLDAEALTPLVSQLESLLGLVTLFAMLASLKKAALSMRADEVYSGASMLSMGTGLLIVFVLVASCLARFEIVAIVGAFATVLFTLMIAVAYVRLVFRASRAIEDLIYG